MNESELKSSIESEKLSSDSDSEEYKEQVEELIERSSTMQSKKQPFL